MTERLWFPKYLIDEVLPAGRETPEAWLPYLLGSEDENRKFLFTPGDVVTFKFLDPRGFVDVDINPDGTLAQSSRCPETSDLFDVAPTQTATPFKHHQPANSFWDWESEVWAATLEEFAELYADPLIDEPVTVSVEAAFWSQTFRYRINDDGKSLTLQTPPADAGAQETSSC
ncbi:hypothetical protein IB237_23480 [Agrobacterium sp. AGB01]|uniref:hypothetical protein n=1 Tax=Agrobacterium sp. AGB01 TaxID=2769302 RepID=UPI00178588EA|nr:hypothetical protein [Agrobacterium sp. AGB01]MBD9390167.1 hypothetical protein [Agrobacterium sp. AGB01]